MDKKSVDHLLEQVREPIGHSMKWHRIISLAAAANAAKDTPAGHRVYLRCISMLEVELGIMNPDNAEVKEGFLGSVEQLIAQAPQDEESPVDDENEGDLLMEQ
jgi:hypothetical protein